MKPPVCTLTRTGFADPEVASNNLRRVARDLPTVTAVTLRGSRHAAGHRLPDGQGELMAVLAVAGECAGQALSFFA